MFIHSFLILSLSISSRAILNYTSPLLAPISTLALKGTWSVNTDSLNHIKNIDGRCVVNFTSNTIPEKSYYTAYVQFYLDPWSSDPFQTLIIRNTTYNHSSFQVSFNDVGMYLQSSLMKKCNFSGVISLVDLDLHIDASGYLASSDCDMNYELVLRSITLEDFKISRALYSMFVFTYNLALCVVLFRIKRNARQSTFYCLSMSIDLLYMNQVMDMSLLVWDIYQYFLIPVNY